MTNLFKNALTELGLGFLFEKPVREYPVISNLAPPALSGLFNSGFCLGLYSLKDKPKTALGNLVHQFKYRFDKKAGEILSLAAASVIKEKFPDTDLIIPVPKSFFSQPFDVVLFSGRIISEENNLPLEKEILIRTRISLYQKRIFNLQEKLSNIEKMFKVISPQKVAHKTILILDDILDTGATLNEITRILKAALAKKVYAFTLAKTGFYR